jgi:hypothetical protein
MKTIRATLMASGLLLAVITPMLSIPCVYAEDAAQPASMDNNSLETNPAAVPQGTVKTLGTLSSHDVSTPVPANNGTTTSGASVPEVAPVAAASEPWTQVLPPQKSGDVTYITGGVGDEERNALSEAKAEFNLYVMSAEKDGAFLGDTQIVIRSAKGDAQLLNVTAGPLLYVKLPPGAYVVEASADGQTKKEKVTIGTKNAANVHFSW